MKIALICGGPSLERGISLNSARSVLDHIASEEIEIMPIYFDSKINPYKISTAQLYSNTPSNFDFKLRQISTPLNKSSLIKFLKNVDLTFPVMHGRFGEDGGIERILEKHNIPFVGSSSKTCKKAFDKFTANEFLKKSGFFTLPSIVLKIYGNDHKRTVEKFFKDYRIERAIVKPSSGGSSIGVFSVSKPDEALEKVRLIFSKRMDTRVVIEPFANGVEFTIIILENRFGLPSALLPTEIETDYTKHQIFDFRRKYLPTRQVIWHCPPRFNDSMIDKIQTQAEQIFTLFQMRDFGRFDGWVLPDGNIWFCDFNPISGMEQNSFLFQQSSMIGMTHSDVLKYIILNVCKRCDIQFPKTCWKSDGKRKIINVLFGGNTSERQVSLMSGTNVWLKLKSSKKYKPKPFLMDMEGNVWDLPYQLALNHTVEEITDNCRNYKLSKQRLNVLVEKARIKLGLLENKNTEEFFEPKMMSFNDFIKNSSFVFNGLHGGDGENGTLQAIFAKNNIAFNGSDAKVSRLCMNKWETSNFIKRLEIKGVNTIPNKVLKTNRLLKMTSGELKILWKKIKKELNGKTLVIKPLKDGCSTGVVHLYSFKDLKKYIDLLASKNFSAPKNFFKNQKNIIEMPPNMPNELLIECFIDTDTLKIKNNQLKHRRKTGWIEITIGVLEINDKIKALNPSITIVENEILTVEEKFQGGTGVNITPPPTSIIQLKILKKIKELIRETAAQIGIKGYARIDAFANITNGNLLIIEINTLPALTASTVFYHQALAENPPIFPRELIELLCFTMV